jgi:hypothetical protein
MEWFSRPGVTCSVRRKIPRVTLLSRKTNEFSRRVAARMEKEKGRVVHPALWRLRCPFGGLE